MATVNKQTIAQYGIDELIEQYRRNSCGHWFDVETMRFFGTRLTSHYRRLDDKTAIFITTEKSPDGKRRASIRVAKMTHKKRRSDGWFEHKIDISTRGEFHSMSLGQAVREFRKIKTVGDL